MVAGTSGLFNFPPAMSAPKENPFPGMNPYLEGHWTDVLITLVSSIRTELNRELPDDLTARAEEEVRLEGRSHAVRPDVSVIDDGWRVGLPSVWKPQSTGSGEGTLIVTEPRLVPVATEETRRWVEVRDSGHRLVTVIEVLSPTNKAVGQGRADYLRKRRDFAAMGVNIVEIDLLRSGTPTVDIPEGWVNEYTLGESGRIDYAVCVFRAEVTGRREVYPASLREPLPIIRVPLRMGDPDVPLDLQSMVDACYETGRYWRLDYHQAFPQPPLSPSDEAWATTCLRDAGLLPAA